MLLPGCIVGSNLPSSWGALFSSLLTRPCRGPTSTSNSPSLKLLMICQCHGSSNSGTTSDFSSSPLFTAPLHPLLLPSPSLQLSLKLWLLSPLLEDCQSLLTGPSIPHHLPSRIHPAVHHEIKFPKMRLCICHSQLETLQCLSSRLFSLIFKALNTRFPAGFFNLIFYFTPSGTLYFNRVGLFHCLSQAGLN